MGVISTLATLMAGGGGAVRLEAADALREVFASSVQLAREVERDAAVAPQNYSALALRELAHAEAEQVARLEQALVSVGEGVPAILEASPAVGTSNHWARLVHTLEAHRASTKRLRELAFHFAETTPSVAGLFDTLCNENVLHCERLRALIARADPQALN